MTDDSLPELDPGLVAASAHFDGVADADERALVDDSEEMQALVGSFAAVKAALNDLPGVPTTDLDDTVAAALAEFDSIAAAAAAAAATGFHRPTAPTRADRSRWSRVLSVAAAAVVIGVVGVVIAKGVGGNSSRSSSRSSSGATTIAAAATTIAGASTADAPLAGAAAAATTAGGAAGQATSTIGAINAAADALPRYDQPNELRTLPGTLADAQVTGESGVPVAPAPAKGTPGSNGIPLTGPLVFPFTCPLTAQQVFIAEISWQGTPAAAVRDTVTGITQAIDPHCKVLVSVEP